jgi:hypothetical protein
MIKQAFSLLLMSTFYSCVDHDNQNLNHLSQHDSTTVPTNTDKVSNAVDKHFLIRQDSITILPFEIDVKLSPKAKERITKAGETLIVVVFFDGIPKHDAPVELEHDGAFLVASAEIEMIYGQVATFNKIRFSKKIYDELVNKNLDVIVNVFIGRKSSPDNLLSGGFFAGKLSDVVNRKITIETTLIYGDD